MSLLGVPTAAQLEQWAKAGAIGRGTLTVGGDAPSPATVPTDEPKVGLDATHKALRDRRLQATYGITESQYERLLALQHGQCAICGRAYTDEHPLVVDHNHAIGEVRGLLCSGCNTGIGLLDDSPVLLAHALVYLHQRGSYAAVTPATFVADLGTPPSR